MDTFPAALVVGVGGELGKGKPQIPRAHSLESRLRLAMDASGV
jgi:hypothetical protein